MEELGSNVLLLIYHRDGAAAMESSDFTRFSLADELLLFWNQLGQITLPVMNLRFVSCILRCCSSPVLILV